MLEEKIVPFPSLAGLTAMIQLDPHAVGMIRSLERNVPRSRITWRKS